MLDGLLGDPCRSRDRDGGAARGAPRVARPLIAGCSVRAPLHIARQFRRSIFAEPMTARSAGGGGGGERGGGGGRRREGGGAAVGRRRGREESVRGVAT